MRPLRHWHLSITTTLLVVLLIGARPAATVLLPTDFTQIVTSADAVAHGRIVSSRAQWADGRRRIETVLVFEVVEYFKGNLGPSIVFRAPGGEMGAWRTVMVGAPVYREGEELVLFLRARPPALPFVLGLGQGVFRIAVDRVSGAKVVTSPVLIARGTTPEPVVRGSPARRPLSIDAFREEIRQVTSKARGERVTPGRERP